VARYVVSADELRLLSVPADATLGALPKLRAGAQKEPLDMPCPGAGRGSPRLIGFEDLRLSPVKLNPSHLELSAVWTGHLDAGAPAIGKNPFRVPAAACANGVALASLRIDGVWVFHALCRARELPCASRLGSGRGKWA
jgi:hypothetical protein